MDIAQITQTLFGTVVGGLIVIATNWISAQRESRKATQEWYEQIYIIEGMDVLIEHLMAMQFQIHNYAMFKPYVPLSDTDTVPVGALARYQSLLKDTTFPTLILYLHIRIGENNPKTENDLDRAVVAQSFVSRGVATELSNIVTTMNDFLFELREELLNIKVRVKHDAHSIYKKEQISQLLKKLEKMSEEIDKRARGTKG
jgi:hypothetical protein